jgi:predicted SAM-dependent methyltransferase
MNLERKSHQNISLFNSDYVLEKSINSFLNRFASSQYATILDFGAGNSPYKSLFTCKQYITADVCQNQDNSINILLDSHKFSPLPIEDNSVDIVLCMDVLEHSENVESILKDFFRVLRTNGLLLISVPFLYREHEMPYDFMRYTSSYMLREVEKAKFGDVEVIKVGNTCFTLYSLWNESHIKNGEQIRISLFERFIKKVFSKCILPFCNKFVFDSIPSSDDGIYHHLLINAKKVK